MTALNSNAGVPGILRMGVGSAADATLAGVQTESPRADAGRGSNRTLSPDSLTEHIQPVDYGSDQAIPSLPLTGIDHPRECDCPEWVTRCAHIDGRTLILGNDIGEHAYQHTCPESGLNALGLWYVANPKGFALCGCGHPICSPTTRALWWGTSEADALAAFYAAEAELLGREA